jgi:hypothetical protein
VSRLLFFFATLLSAQQLQPDTQSLAARLKRVRAQDRGLGADSYAAIQKVFLAWVDVRLKNRATVESLRRELKQARLSGAGRDEFWGIDHTGLLEIAPVPVPDDLFALRLGIGVAIDYDQTIVLYQRRPWRRIGWLNHGLTSGEYSLFSSFEVGEKDGAGRRLIASGGYPIILRYQGPFDVKLRLDVLEAASLKTLLNREESAEFDWEQKTVADQFVSASIEDDVVTFQYLRILHDESRAAAVFRYSVSGDTLTRIPPIALTRSSFIDEWVRVDDPTAWSAPEALEGHRAINEFLKLHKGDQHFYFDKISLCPGSPQTWQIVASSAFNAPTKTWVFVLAESGSSNMRMLKVDDVPDPACIEKDLIALVEELPE